MDSKMPIYYVKRGYRKSEISDVNGKAYKCVEL